MRGNVSAARWTAFLASLREEHIVLYAMLCEAAPALSEGKLTLLFPPGYVFHKQTLEGERRAELLEAVRRVFGEVEVVIGEPEAFQVDGKTKEELRAAAERVRAAFNGRWLGVYARKG